MRRPCSALSRDDAGNEVAFAGIDGAELARAFEDIVEQPDDFPVSPADYADLFETAIADRTCRRAETPGAHVRILGPLEARLVNVDRVVLGGLVDGVWPPETRSDPWLSRPMRLELGLDLPGAARRPVGARLRAVARAARGDPDARRQARRRADGRVALHAAARGGRRRDALEAARSRAAKNISPGRAISIAPKPSRRRSVRVRCRRSTRGRTA